MDNADTFFNCLACCMFFFLSSNLIIPTISENERFSRLFFFLRSSTKSLLPEPIIHEAMTRQLFLDSHVEITNVYRVVMDFISLSTDIRTRKQHHTLNSNIRLVINCAGRVQDITVLLNIASKERKRPHENEFKNFENSSVPFRLGGICFGCTYAYGRW